MEWYFENGVDELVVPREREASEREASDGWMQWGISGAESFDSPNKYFVTEAKPTGEIDFNHESFSDAVDMDFFSPERDQSSSSSVCGSLSEASNLRARVLRDRPDYQLDDLAATNQMDENFLSSLFEDDLPGGESSDRFLYSPQRQSTMTSIDNLSGDATLDSQSILSNFQDVGNFKYHKKMTFSPAVGWENSQVDTSHCIPFNLEKDFSPLKAPLEKASVACNQNSIDGHVGEESCLEESVLHELETVMEQMTEKTRICFRDALYRLAKNAKQHTIFENQYDNVAAEGVLQTTVHDETLRSGQEKISESETNTIDRTVANLMFSNMDFTSEDHTTALMDFEQGTISKINPSNYGLNQPQMYHFTLSTSLPGDAEVPVFT